MQKFNKHFFLTLLKTSDLYSFFNECQINSLCLNIPTLSRTRVRASWGPSNIWCSWICPIRSLQNSLVGPPSPSAPSPRPSSSIKTMSSFDSGSKAGRLKALKAQSNSSSRRTFIWLAVGARWWTPDLRVFSAEATSKGLYGGSGGKKHGDYYFF